MGTTKSSTTDFQYSASRTARGAKYLSLVVAFLSLAGIGVCLFFLHRVNGKMVRAEQRIEILSNADDSRCCFIDDDNIRLISIEAAQKEFDSYIDSQSNLLAIFSMLTTAMVALVGFVIPLYINREQGNANKEKIDVEVAKGIADLKEKTNVHIRTVKSEMTHLLISEKNSIKMSNDRIERMLKEYKLKIDGMLEDLSARQENHAESIKIEQMDDEKERIIAYMEQETEGRATSDTYFHLGNYYVKEKQPDVANRYFSKAVENRENYAAVYPIWADTLESQGMLLVAWQKREKAIMLNANKQELEKKQENLLERILNPNTTHDEKLTIEVDELEFDMILVHKGVFKMGATREQGDDDPWANERPVHKVLLSDYYISKTVVTQSLWEAVMKPTDKSYRTRSEKDDCPMCNISWNDCVDFIKELNKKTSRTFLLPTEAQWEFAARGGCKSKNYKYSGSDVIGEAVWYWKNSGDSQLNGLYETDKINNNNCRTHSVKDESKKENELGLCGMNGNVWEWCRDKYRYYSADPQVNPVFEDGQECVIRGGGCYSYERNCRVSSRFYYAPDNREQDLGFRLVIEL